MRDTPLRIGQRAGRIDEQIEIAAFILVSGKEVIKRVDHSQMIPHYHDHRIVRKRLSRDPFQKIGRHVVGADYHIPKISIYGRAERIEISVGLMRIHGQHNGGERLAFARQGLYFLPRVPVGFPVPQAPSRSPALGRFRIASHQRLIIQHIFRRHMVGSEKLILAGKRPIAALDESQLVPVLIQHVRQADGSG